MSANKKFGLGRGLDALLGSNAGLATGPTSIASEKELKHIPVDLLQRGQYQPRRDMQPEALEELAASIKTHGVMQPVVIRPIGQGRYEIIAGERRWRATQLAGLDTIPAVIKDVSDEAAMAMALIENIQREDLNPIEEALALSRLHSEFALTHEQIAQAVGKSRSTVTNLLRLMDLKEEVKEMMARRELEMGHARALLSLTTQQVAVAQTVKSKGLPVRQTEALVRQLQAAKTTHAKNLPSDPNTQRLQEELSERISSPVVIQHSPKGNGKLVISYNSLAELDGILKRIR